jgi:hypothetical protein
VNKTNPSESRPILRQLPAAMKANGKEGGSKDLPCRLSLSPSPSPSPPPPSLLFLLPVMSLASERRRRREEPQRAETDNTPRPPPPPPPPLAVIRRRSTSTTRSVGGGGDRRRRRAAQSDDEPHGQGEKRGAAAPPPRKERGRQRPGRAALDTAIDPIEPGGPAPGRVTDLRRRLRPFRSSSSSSSSINLPYMYLPEQARWPVRAGRAPSLILSHV